MAELIRARHAELDAVAEVPDTDFWRDKGWVKVDDDTPTSMEVRDLYDPSAHNVDEVVAYLANVDDPAEHARVKAVEATGQARKTVLEWTAPGS